MGGWWIKVDRGWRWYSGDTFPAPGGDWTGELIYPGEEKIAAGEIPYGPPIAAKEAALEGK